MEWNEFAIAQTLNSWIDAKHKSGESVPDFWSELNTTEDLAKWLHDSGLKYSR